MALAKSGDMRENRPKTSAPDILSIILILMSFASQGEVESSRTWKVFFGGVPKAFSEGIRRFSFLRISNVVVVSEAGRFCEKPGHRSVQHLAAT
jgi:hypothetical protein